MSDTENEPEVGVNLAVIVGVALVSLVQAAYLGVQRLRRKAASWRPAVVIGIEAIFYMFTAWIRATGGERMTGTVIVNARGIEVEIGRFIGWFLTCPILIDSIANLELEINFVSELNKAGTTGDTGSFSSPSNWWMSAVMGGMLTCVVGASMAGTITQTVAFFFVGGAQCGLLFVGIGRVVLNLIKREPDITSAKALLGTFYIGWSMFPIVWVLSPLGFNVISTATAGTAYTVADLVAKNLLGLLLNRVAVLSVRRQLAAIHRVAISRRSMSFGPKSVITSSSGPSEPADLAISSSMGLGGILKSPSVPQLRLKSQGYGDTISQDQVLQRIDSLQHELRMLASASVSGGNRVNSPYPMAPMSTDSMRRPDVYRAGDYPARSMTPSEYQLYPRNDYTPGNLDTDAFRSPRHDGIEVRSSLSVSDPADKGQESGSDRDNRRGDRDDGSKSDNSEVLALDSIVSDWDRK